MKTKVRYISGEFNYLGFENGSISKMQKLIEA
jgi:hypothetical protein